MTDEQIIKSLECCNRIGGSCNDCPLYCGVSSCIKNLTLNALDLINRQKAEIGRLQTRNDELNILNKTVAQEAIKEFAERFKKSAELYDCIRAIGNVSKIDCLVDTFDNLVKEMTEE